MNNSIKNLFGAFKESCFMKKLEVKNLKYLSVPMCSWTALGHQSWKAKVSLYPIVSLATMHTSIVGEFWILSRAASLSSWISYLIVGQPLYQLVEFANTQKTSFFILLSYLPGIFCPALGISRLSLLMLRRLGTVASITLSLPGTCSPALDHHSLLAC